MQASTYERGTYEIDSAAPNRRAVQADYEGDGKSDVSVYRSSFGSWYLVDWQTEFSATQFGVSTDRIAPAYYHNDCKSELVVYRSSADSWY